MMKKILTILILTCCLITVGAQSITDTVVIGDETNLESTAIGTVYSATTGHPIEGASVAFSDVSSDFTDEAGHFTLSTPNLMVAIIVEAPGYQKQLIPIKKQDSVIVYLNELNYHSSNQLFKNYYNTELIAHTSKNAVTISNNTDNWQNKSSSFESMLEGELPGLRVLHRSGMPGIGANMFVNGFTSMYGSNQPLIVVDGYVIDVPFDEYSPIDGYGSNQLAFIDENDIENISLVKDASSVYGSRAGNGVLFVTTKRSQDVATKIAFNAISGVRESSKQLPMLGANDFRLYLSDILQSSGLSADSIANIPFMLDDPSREDYFRYHNNTNWQDEIFTNGKFQKYNLRISGGDDVALYTISVGYTSHEDVIKNRSFSGYSARFNSDINVSPKFTMNVGMSFASNNYLLKEEGQVKTSPIHQSLVKGPNFYPFLLSSTGVASPIYENVDPLGISNPRVITDNLEATSDNYQIFGLFNANYKLTESISFHNQIGVDFHKGRNNLFVPHNGIAADTLTIGIAENTMAHQVARYFNLTNDFRVSYTKAFSYLHHVNVMAGSRVSTYRRENDWAQGHNSPNDEIKTIGQGSNIFRSIGGALTDINYVSYYLSAGYNYALKYFIDVNTSLDGSSQYGDEAEGVSLAGNIYGVFPSVSAAWLLSSEEFLNQVKPIDYLKLRASYGFAGNSNFSQFPSTKTYSSQGFIGSQGLVQSSLYAPALQWEKVKKTSVGIDVEAFKRRVGMSASIFQNTTSKMYNIIKANPYSGLSFYIDNNGSFKSEGLDLSVNIRAIDTRDFKWDVSANISKYKTEILELPASSQTVTIYGGQIISRVGQPLGQFYGFKTNGVYSTQADAVADGNSTVLPNTNVVPFGAGDVIFEDLDGNKIIDDKDRQVIGDPNPDFVGMFNSELSYKGISLAATFTFSYGNDIYNQLRSQLESQSNTHNQSEATINRWKEEGQVTDIPKVVAGDPLGNARFSDRWIEDGSYLRVKNVTLSYDIPKLPQLIRGLEIFISAENLYTFTNYLGYDPEVSISSLSLAQGIDIGMSPVTKSVYGGIKLNF